MIENSNISATLTLTSVVARLSSTALKIFELMIVFSLS